MPAIWPKLGIIRVAPACMDVGFPVGNAFLLLSMIAFESLSSLVDVD